MKADLLHLDCDEELAWAAQEMYHEIRKRVHEKVQYAQPDVGSRIIIELSIRIQRWVEFIVAGARVGLDTESQALCRVPLELHVSQLLIGHGVIERNKLRRRNGQLLDSNATGTLTKEELGKLFNNHSRLEKLGLIKTQTMHLGSDGPEHVARVQAELEAEVQGYAFLATNPKQDWHGQSPSGAFDAAMAVRPGFIDEYGIGGLVAALPDVVAFFQKQLHASSLPGTFLYTASENPEETKKLLGDAREPGHAGARWAGFIALGSSLLVCEAVDELSVGLALAAQYIETLERAKRGQ